MITLIYSLTIIIIIIIIIATVDNVIDFSTHTNQR